MSFEDNHEVCEIPATSRMRRQSAELLYKRIKAQGEGTDKRALLNTLQIPHQHRRAITGVLSIGDGRYLVYRE